MRRLPHTVTLLRPTTVTDGYGDKVPGPVAPVGSPFPGWLQEGHVAESPTGTTTRAPILFVWLSAPELSEDDLVKVKGGRLKGDRFKVDGPAIERVSPGGRAKFRRYRLSRVTKGA